MPKPKTTAVTPQTEAEDRTIAEALAILFRRCKRHDVVLGSPGVVRDYLRLHLGQLEHEVFVVLFLDVKNRLITKEDLFRGTLTCTSVHPREVAKRALAHNCASIMVAHNHPSGVSTPSDADRHMTRALKQALELVDVRVLDHFVVAQDCAPYSFAEHGEI